MYYTYFMTKTDPIQPSRLQADGKAKHCLKRLMLAGGAGNVMLDLAPMLGGYRRATIALSSIDTSEVLLLPWDP